MTDANSVKVVLDIRFNVLFLNRLGEFNKVYSSLVPISIMLYPLADKSSINCINRLLPHCFVFQALSDATATIGRFIVRTSVGSADSSAINFGRVSRSAFWKIPLSRRIAFA